MFSDNFDRADNVNVGNGWTEIASSVWSIFNNTLRAIAPGPTSYNQRIEPPASANMYNGTISVEFNPSVSGSFPQVLFRLTDGATLTGYSVYVNEANGRFAYGTIDDDTYVEIIGNSLGAGVINPGSWYRFNINLNDSSIQLQLYEWVTDAWVLLNTINSTNSAHSGNGVALTVNNTSDPGNVVFDNFTAIPAEELTNQSITNLLGKSVDLSVDTATGSGTIYGIITTDQGIPSAAQIVAGVDATGTANAVDWSDSQVVISTGTETFNASGLAPNTSTYKGWIVQDTDDAGSYTNIIEFDITTKRVGIRSAPIYDTNGSLLASLTGLSMTIKSSWNSDTELAEVNDAAFDASGILEYDIAPGALDIGDNIYGNVRVSPGKFMPFETVLIDMDV